VSDVIEAEVLSELSTYQDVRGVRNDTGRVLRRGDLVWWRVNAAGVNVALATGQRGKRGCGMGLWIEATPPGGTGTAALVGSFRIQGDGGRSGLYLEERSLGDRPLLAPPPVDGESR
jgi:hypothetical protein